MLTRQWTMEVQLAMQQMKRKRRKRRDAAELPFTTLQATTQSNLIRKSTRVATKIFVIDTAGNQLHFEK